MDNEQNIIGEPLSGGKEVHEENFTEVEAVINGENLTGRTWTFKAIQVGSCLVEAGAVFTLYEDGATSWTCEISSGDSGDEWTMSITIKDARGVNLFKTNRYYYDIKKKDKKRRWEDRRGPNPNFAQYFDQANQAEANCSC